MARSRSPHAVSLEAPTVRGGLPPRARRFSHLCRSCGCPTSNIGLRTAGWRLTGRRVVLVIVNVLNCLIFRRQTK